MDQIKDLSFKMTKKKNYKNNIMSIIKMCDMI